jgi:hypothetical protein
MSSTNIKRFLTLFFILFLFSSCAPVKGCEGADDPSCTRVLFIGNSLTYYNDLPNMFAQLARSGKHKVEVGMYAQGGWALEDHVKSAESTNAINSQKWTYVVLQEQSAIPAVEGWRSYNMFPAARTLVGQVRNMGATPLFYLTWARRAGFPEYGMYGYESMQDQVNNGYYAIAGELGVPVVPVGSAWRLALAEHPELSLFLDDGNHPTEQGSYLAACVFYEAIFQESPVKLRYRGNLSKETATIIQTIASEVKY